MMVDDTKAISGTHGGYVPCHETPLPITASGQDANAAYGNDEGFVHTHSTAVAESADGTDTSATFGQGRGYVAGPCEDCVSLVNGLEWGNMDAVGGSATSWTGTRTNQTGAGSFTRQTVGGSQTTGAGWATIFPATPSHQENEGRSYASIDITAYPTATHATLHATLRNYIGLIELSYVIGNEADVLWELVAGTWGTGTPTWDNGTVVASGTIPASTAFFDADGIVVAPVESIDIDATFPVTYPYAQWYFRVVSTYGYRHPTAAADLFTPGVVDLRYPNETFVDPHTSPTFYESLRSYVSLLPSTASAFEDWTLDVLHCS